MHQVRVPKRLNSEGQQIGVHNHLGLQMGEQVNILGQGQNFGWGGEVFWLGLIFLGGGVNFWMEAKLWVGVEIFGWGQKFEWGAKTWVEGQKFWWD